MQKSITKYPAVSRHLQASTSLLTSSARLLIEIANSDSARIRIADIAAELGLSERTVSTLWRRLEDDGMLGRQRVQRRNLYNVNRDALLTDIDNCPVTVGALLDIFPKHELRGLIQKLQ